MSVLDWYNKIFDDLSENLSNGHQPTMTRSQLWNLFYFICFLFYCFCVRASCNVGYSWCLYLKLFFNLFFLISFLLFFFLLISYNNNHVISFVLFCFIFVIFIFGHLVLLVSSVPFISPHFDLSFFLSSYFLLLSFNLTISSISGNNYHSVHLQPLFYFSFSYLSIDLSYFLPI